MKTRELIAALQEADPSGELDCVVGNEAIEGVHDPHAAYDGPYERIRFGEDGQAIGADYVREGRKVVLLLFGIDTLLLDDPEAPVGFIGFTPEQQERCQLVLDRLPADSRRIKWREEKLAKARAETN